MHIKTIMDEYSLETNDIRWYLADKLAYKLLNYVNHKEDLIKYIESGSLESELYDMEEKYIMELQDLADRSKLDEVNLREIFNETSLLKLKRYK